MSVLSGPDGLSHLHRMTDKKIKSSQIVPGVIESKSAFILALPNNCRFRTALKVRFLVLFSQNSRGDIRRMNKRTIIRVLLTLAMVLASC